MPSFEPKINNFFNSNILNTDKNKKQDQLPVVNDINKQLK